MVKIERSYPAPESLAFESVKANGSYSEPDVVNRLCADVHNKCYICELDSLHDPQVEHLLPHENGKYPERKYDWDNLFWACGHCNSVKNQKKYSFGILNCCKRDPEEAMRFRLEESEVKVDAKDALDDEAVLTSELVREVFNLKNTGMRVYKSNFRFHELNMEMNLLFDNLEIYKHNPESRTCARKLKALLRKESRFAAFKRCYIRENSQFPELLKYVQ